MTDVEDPDGAAIPRESYRLLYTLESTEDAYKMVVNGGLMWTKQQRCRKEEDEVAKTSLTVVCDFCSLLAITASLTDVRCAKRFLAPNAQRKPFNVRDVSSMLRIIGKRTNSRGVKLLSEYRKASLRCTQC